MGCFILKTKGQTWTADFIFGLLLFTFALIFSVKFTTNNLSTSNFDEVYQDSKYISDNFMSEGVPVNWTADYVFRIGILSDNKLNISKLLNMSSMNYGEVKGFLNTRYDYYIFFADKFDNVVNLSGFCGYGNSRVKIDYRKNIAYYYQSDNLLDNKMRGIMEDQYNAQIYYDSELDSLLADISNYSLIVMENPRLDTKSSKSAEEIALILDNWIKDGRVLYLSEDLDVGDINILGINNSPTFPVDNQIIVINPDPTLPLYTNQVFDPVHLHAVKPLDSNINFRMIANFTGLGGESAGIASWTYGLGRAYYFTDTALDSGGNLSNEINQSIKIYSMPSCGKINAKDLNAKDLVKMERFVVYNQKIFRMKILIWNR